MLQPVNSASGAPSIPASGIHQGTDIATGSTAATDENQSVLYRLPAAGTWGEQMVKQYYGACTPTAPVALLCPSFDAALFRRHLAEWGGDQTVGLARVSDQQMTEALQSALIAAVTISMAHSVEMVLLAFSNHPLVRIAAVSHPYVVSTFLEGVLKRMAGVQDPDPENRTGVRYKEKIVAALVNWNHVQPALDGVLKTPLARCLKVVATAVFSAVRDLAERANTIALLQDLPADAPPGPAKLTDGETLFVNCLMCWLRNVGVDLIRQVVRTGGPGAIPATGPVAKSLMERFVRPVFLGDHVPGGLPAAAIAAQPAFAGAIEGLDDHLLPGQPRQSRTDEILQQAHDLF